MNSKKKYFCIWFTGLSGSGKTTLALKIQKELHKIHRKSYMIDGDILRSGLNDDLTFSKKDRTENIRRLGHIAKILVEAEVIAIVSAITPFEQHRNMVKKIINNKEFVEIYLSTSLKICEKRDVKGLYKKARNAEIKKFTGISSPYEIPKNPNIVLNTEVMTISECVNEILVYLKSYLK